MVSVRAETVLSKIADLGLVLALVGIGILLVFPIHRLVLYASSTFLLAGSVLGFVSAMRVRIMQVEPLAIFGLEFFAGILMLLKYYGSDLFSSAALAAVAFILPVFCGLCVAGYRGYRERRPLHVNTTGLVFASSSRS